MPIDRQRLNAFVVAEVDAHPPPASGPDVMPR